MRSSLFRLSGGVQYVKSNSPGKTSNGEAIDYLQKILTSRVYDVSIESPLQQAKVLSSKLGNKVYFKREDLQPVFSFKCRGAHNKISSLSADQLKNGIVACSAGNHAQGVALSAKNLNIDAIIVMPVATPSIKIDGVKKLGGVVKLHGNNYDEAQTEALRMVIDEGRSLIHPFDDPEVIAGQGTVGLEILKALTRERLDAIFCCVGGGGLIAGVAAYVKRVRPEVKIIGVEAEDSAAMTVSLKAGKRIKLDNVCLFADGAAVRLVGEETFRLASMYVDAMVTVSNDEICAAIKDTFNDTRTILEPAGALSVAGITKYIKSTGLRDGTYVGITSGANMDFDRLRFVSERADARETRVCVKIPEKPGSFLKLYSLIFPRNVTEFSYRYNDETVANIYMSFHGKSPEDVVGVIDLLNKEGFVTKDLSDNELAKAHARHLAGGRAKHRLVNEELYRFEFPETPGALDRFLRKLPSFVNISLFHYRNYGHDIGRVLVGMQVPVEHKETLQSSLLSLGYKYFDETKNMVYQDFL